MKAFVKGFTGMVGSHLADYLPEHTNWEIYGMSRRLSPFDNVEHFLDRANRKDRLHFIDGDLCDYASLLNAVEESRPDYVFHLSAQKYPLTSLISPLQTLDNNVLGTEHLCRYEWPIFFSHPKPNQFFKYKMRKQHTKVRKDF